MSPYFDGDSFVSTVRVSPPPPITHGPAPILMIARQPSEECGCPEEWWRIDGLEYIIHMERDGTGDILIFAGDWEQEHNVKARGLDHLRALMFSKHADIMEKT